MRTGPSHQQRVMTGLVLVTSWHAGFQAVVTGLVYPALAEVPPSRWPQAHDAHSRRITPLVGLTYAALAGGCVAALATRGQDRWVQVACASSALAVGTTAVVAAPLHGLLGRERTPTRVRRLLLVDRARTAAAVVAGAAALGALGDA